MTNAAHFQVTIRNLEDMWFDFFNTYQILQEKSIRSERRQRTYIHSISHSTWSGFKQCNKFHRSLSRHGPNEALPVLEMGSRKNNCLPWSEKRKKKRTSILINMITRFGWKAQDNPVRRLERFYRIGAHNWTFNIDLVWVRIKPLSGVSLNWHFLAKSWLKSKASKPTPD